MFNKHEHKRTVCTFSSIMRRSESIPKLSNKRINQNVKKVKKKEKKEKEMPTEARMIKKNIEKQFNTNIGMNNQKGTELHFC